MQLPTPYRDLGAIDASPLIDAVLRATASDWAAFDHRQRAYDVHHDTQSLVLLFCDDAWPEVTISRQAGAELLGPAAEPLMAGILARGYPPGGVIVRAMAAKLKAGGRIATHIDALPSFRHSHRIHLPLTTSAAVRFTIDGRPCPMQVGRAYEIDNQRPHSVMNTGADDRVSFIFDYAPPGACTPRA